MQSGVIVEPSFRNATSQVAQTIPTQDAEAALAFCRTLAQTLNGNAPLANTAAVQAGLNRPILSVVIPVCNEQENLEELYGRLTRALESVEPDFEILFVDDGSRDRSLGILTRMAQNDVRVSVIAFARNFGHQAAISAGLDQARGNAVVVMDADLQDPPEVLGQFIAKWREGNDVVYAIRGQRKEGWVLRTCYAAFYRLLQRVANIEIPLDAGDFCIMDRRVVDLLVNMPERNRFVRGIRSWVGLRQIGLKYDRAARFGGATKYSYSRLVALALDGLVSFSYVPLRVISMAGIGVSIISILLAIIYAIQKVFWGLSPPGFPTTIVAIFFLAGIQLITIGLIGEYVGRIFEEVKRRPMYVVRQVIRKS
ncbi:MAG: glycosyltransferase family 2 protein [Anaerolineae bacterium]|nr:glycosyltransferase family 2 protein [Anaerolineae bacterium]